jgi:hypothetical protein
LSTRDQFVHVLRAKEDAQRSLVTLWHGCLFQLFGSRDDLALVSFRDYGLLEGKITTISRTAGNSMLSIVKKAVAARNQDEAGMP